MTDTTPPVAPGHGAQNTHSNGAFLSRFWKWIDHRTGVDALLRKSLDEPIPGGARVAFVFGSALLFIFVSQVITGICLTVYYVPSPLTAHVTLSYIIKDVAAGAFLRSLHSYGSSAMVVVLAMHFLQTVLYGSYKGRRELLWMTGCVLALMVLGMTFTGYLLRWDLKAYFAGSVGTNIAGEVPLIGGWLLRLVRGGATMGAMTLSRFYVLHVFLVPAIIFVFVAVHLLLFRKAGPAGPIAEDPVQPRLPTETFYPKQVIIDMLFVLLVMGVLGTLAYFVPEGLGPAADPSNSSYLPRPEWYYLPFFEWLKFWDGPRTVIGVIAIPGLLIGLLFILPFLDRGRERRPWRRPIAVGGVMIVLLGIIGLGLQSRLDDSRDAATATQIARQELAEAQYFRAPFEPYAASPNGQGPPAPMSVAASEGQRVFDAHGCAACHGMGGVGGGIGPALTHIGDTLQAEHLTALLIDPSAKMRAGGMTPSTLNATDMGALVAYVRSLGAASAGTATAPATSIATAPTPAPMAVPSPPPAAVTAAPAAGAGPSSQRNAPGDAIFASHGCSGCHGMGGVGGAVAPALTHVSEKFRPAQLTALLRQPTAKMQAGGMVPSTLGATDMAALVSYLRGLGAPSRATGKAAAPAKTAAQGPEQAPPVTAPPAAPVAVSPPAPPTTGVVAPAAPSAALAQGKTLFSSHNCISCHGPGGIGGGIAPALTHIGDTFQPPQLTALLRAPTAKMQAGGMVPLTLSTAEMSALVDYVRSLGTPPTSNPPAASGAVASAAPASSASAGADGQPSASAAPPSGPPKQEGGEADSASPTAINAGRKIYNGESNCWMCHGARLEGTPVAPTLLAHQWKDAPDGAYDAIVGAVLSGVPGTAMPGRAGGISDAEVHRVAAYVWAVGHGKAKP